MVSAVVLAGGSVKPDLQAQFDIPSKRMIPLLGRTAANSVVDAARACSGIGKVALAGPEAYRDLLTMERVDAFVPDAGRIPGNLINAMAALGEEQGRGLMVAGASPVLTGEALDGFLSWVPEDADLCCPAVTKKGVLAVFPDREWTFHRLREAEVMCTNILFSRASLLKSFEGLADHVEVARRKPWTLAALFGPWLLVGYPMGWLPIPAPEARLSEILGAKCYSVLTDDALLAMDLDDAYDVPFVEGFLERRGTDAVSDEPQ